MINTGFTKVSIGSFTSRLGLFRPVQKKNERGAVENEYQYEKDIFGKVVEIAGTETDVDNNLIALNNIEITTYFVPQLTTSWRIGYNGNIYDIIAINKVESQPLITLRAMQMMQ